MTFEEFLDKVNHLYLMQNETDDLRLGQVFFNELCKVRPAIANELRGSFVDPFFKERITNVTKQFVQERW